MGATKNMQEIKMLKILGAPSIHYQGVGPLPKLHFHFVHNFKFIKTWSSKQSSALAGTCVFSLVLKMVVQ